MLKHFIKLSAVAAFAFAFVVAPVASAATTAVYDAVPSLLPPNVPSLGFQATRTSEFGDYVHLGGSERALKNITVTMSTWALYSEYANNDSYNGNTETWAHPITVNVYGAALDENGEPSQLLATTTQTVDIPWRPAADPNCATPTAWKANDGKCYNGKAFNATFDFSNLNVTLPNDVIIGVAYNTQTYGKTPLNVAGPYNSLNVGIPDNQVVAVGEDDDSDVTFWDTTYPGYTAGFKADSNWTPNGTVAFKINADKSVVTSKTECQNNGWKGLMTSDMKSFKNQGQCVAYVQANENSKLKRDTVTQTNLKY